jgi:uncharacterized Tic20 family protein
MSRATGAPAQSIALRSGGSLDIWPDRVIADGRAYPLAELAGATLAGDAAAPAVALLGRDGRWDTYVPADPPDAQRALGAIYLLRPDLRAGAARATAASYGLAPGSGTEQTVLAGIAHLSFFFAPFVLPLIIWLATQQTSPYASRQAKQAFFFHLVIALVTAAIIAVLAAVFVATLLVGLATGDARAVWPGLILFPAGVLAVVALGLAGLGFSIYAAVETFQGHPFSYPFLRRL